MNPLHIVLATRRFWPLTGGEPTAVSHLAAGLLACGARATVLSFRWRRDWPEHVEHRGVPVIRLPARSSDRWGTARQLRSMAGWLRRHAAEYDLACVSGLRHEACAALWMARRAGKPVVLRAMGCGLTGDCHWQLDARCGQRIKRMCQRADALVGSSSAIERELIAAGYPRERIHRIPCGATPAEPRSAEARRAARRALAQAHPALSVEDDATIAVYTGGLHAAKGLAQLVEAWGQVSARHPAARLWLVGDGPEEAALAERARRLGMAAAVTLPGAFDPVDDFLAAADVYVHPALEDGTNLGVIEAMAAGLPIVASDIPGHRDLIEHERHGLLTPVEQPAALAAAVNRAFDDRAAAQGWGAAARDRAAREFTSAQMVRRHLDLFQSILAGRGK